MPSSLLSFWSAVITATAATASLPWFSDIGAYADITLEISAEVPGGIAEEVVRTVSENCQALKFKTCEFEG